jgi:SAM-dependent methyltransferase
MNKFFFYFLLFFYLSSCKSPISQGNTTFYPPSVTEKQFKNNESRDVWQRPSEVLDLLGPVKGLTVADIGAGTGFFSFRLLFRKAHVIAIDINPKMLQIIENFKGNLNQERKNNIETRLALPDDPKLNKDEADIIIIINTMAYIDNRENYLKALHEKLPKSGRIMIVDFKSKELPIETLDSKDRIPLYKMEKNLKDAGFQRLSSYDKLLDYQYVIVAEK